MAGGNERINLTINIPDSKPVKFRIYQYRGLFILPRIGEKIQLTFDDKDYLVLVKDVLHRWFREENGSLALVETYIESDALEIK